MRFLIMVQCDLKIHVVSVERSKHKIGYNVLTTRRDCRKMLFFLQFYNADSNFKVFELQYSSN